MPSTPTPPRPNRLAPASFWAAIVVTLVACQPDPPPPIAEATTTEAARLGFDDPTTVAADAVTTPARGAAEPLVVVTIFSDLQCPFCRAVPALADALAAAWPDEVQIHFRDLPLTAIHPLARTAAIAARAAHRQGSYPCFTRALYATQPDWRRDDHLAFRERLRDAADACRLDLVRFEADLADLALARAVDADVARAQALGVEGTPALLVNGRPVHRSVSPARTDTVRSAIRREAALGRRAVANGQSAHRFLRERITHNTAEDHAADWLLDDRRP